MIILSERTYPQAQHLKSCGLTSIRMIIQWFISLHTSGRSSPNPVPVEQFIACEYEWRRFTKPPPSVMCDTYFRQLSGNTATLFD